VTCVKAPDLTIGPKPAPHAMVKDIPAQKHAASVMEPANGIVHSVKEASTVADHVPDPAITAIIILAATVPAKEAFTVPFVKVLALAVSVITAGVKGKKMSDAVVVKEWAASMFAKNAPSIPKVEKAAFLKNSFCDNTNNHTKGSTRLLPVQFRTIRLRNRSIQIECVYTS